MKYFAMAENKVKIGLIGGSGLEKIDILSNINRKEVDTPFGKPSEEFVTGEINGREVVILARHGKSHSVCPSKVNYRANIWGMKELGVTHIIATTACGSLKEEIKPGHFVFIDQFIDRTKRESTFYTGQPICHIPMAEPFCDKIREELAESAKELELHFHAKGTMLTVQGPRFSTKAESKMFRQWGGDVINMTTVPEVVLAREAGICYAAMAMSTDYDCWHESEQAVDIEMVLKVMKENAENAVKIITKTIPKISWQDCSCREAIKTALL